MRVAVVVIVVASFNVAAAQAPINRAAVRVQSTDNCQPAPVPVYTPPTRVPPPPGGRNGKADGIDGAVTPALFSSSPYLSDSLETALQSLRALTSAQPDWIGKYMQAEKASATGRTADGRLWLRLEAIERIAASQKK